MDTKGGTGGGVGEGARCLLETSKKLLLDAKIDVHGWDSLLFSPAEVFESAWIVGPKAVIVQVSRLEWASLENTQGIANGKTKGAWGPGDSTGL